MTHHPSGRVLKVFLQISVSQTGILSGALGILTGGFKYRRDRERIGTGRNCHNKRIGILTDVILSGDHCSEERRKRVRPPGRKRPSWTKIRSNHTKTESEYAEMKDWENRSTRRKNSVRIFWMHYRRRPALSNQNTTKADITRDIWRTHRLWLFIWLLMYFNKSFI